MKNRTKEKGKREVEQKYVRKQDDRNALISLCDGAMVPTKKKDLDNWIKNNIYA